MEKILEAIDASHARKFAAAEPSGTAPAQKNC